MFELNGGRWFEKSLQMTYGNNSNRKKGRRIKEIRLKHRLLITVRESTGQNKKNNNITKHEK